MKATRELEPGFQLPCRTKLITQEIMTRYANMMSSALAAVPTTAGKSIHTDQEFARGQEMSQTMADGMILTGIFSAMLTEFFAEGYLRGGKLVTKFIRPVGPNDEISFKSMIKEKVTEHLGVRFNLELLCHNQKGETVLVGTASAVVR